MANIKSAKKRIKTSARNRQLNLFYKNKVKRLMKEAIKAISEKKENVLELVKTAQKWIDKAAIKKVYKKNNAARKKSRLMRLNAASGKR
ncbi:30S ribosomal protein S20 [candidate division WOR-1 bacterium RIFOXYA12_FULL_43_27]|uniref:Small ribosomal subunit protein bS20 n=1 Tax=candidate division WOR-1 bacterium RIFOXYC2_FULL_46_14 TaxID=1802587 RepID=A0A1F4U7V5_UNCSA|nr:MAG: 30S ribosomal protein S20 [candidate division WOR-1 bacterium RIFOXYA12_FULL_43_27]OGC19330.1 MAG: 30S ribosomal protein S20 [candidate division WOR-1 bacterium RIFOXYB2_FULL_46_45]OGC30319.1 MAG: 30S ribosomal protein S20 [candidate division WOR-1 bacterium RIFOXYA2_FULL_46_56]OGC40920.1 MAG: 30S ribosomal protein S20 [candidate division WOR-1 bacterium RIFOXYC2_FULL_46_14]